MLRRSNRIRFNRHAADTRLKNSITHEDFINKRGRTINKSLLAYDKLITLRPVAAFYL
jgi:hypothetical protein